MKNKSKKSGKRGKKNNTPRVTVPVVAAADVSEDEGVINGGSEGHKEEGTSENPIERMLREDPLFEEMRSAKDLLIDTQGRCQRMADLVGLAIKELAAVNKIIEKTSGTFMDCSNKILLMVEEQQRKQEQEQKQEEEQKQKQEQGQKQKEEEEQKQKQEEVQKRKQAPKQLKQPEPQLEQRPPTAVEQHQQTYSDSIQVLKKVATHRARSKKMVRIKMTDIDILATGTDIVEAIKERIGITIPSPPLQRHRRDELVSKGRLMILGTPSKLKIVDPLPKELQRCSRCLERGHIARKCEGVDRSNLCLQCAQPGHSSTTCSEIPKCILCGNEHRMGARTCPLPARSA
uniref:Uncharacterized protein n=1 Tax=Anopheles albimanus TaxID=7167 RepID=A0A182FZA5_ANOAL